MDTSSIYLKHKNDRDCIAAIRGFVESAFQGKPVNGKISCPCRGCITLFERSKDEVFRHLVDNGFMKNYDKHSVQREISSNVAINHSLVGHDMIDLLHDIGQTMVADENMNEDEDIDIDDCHVSASPETSNSTNRFYDLVKDADKELYPNCQMHSKLSCVVKLYHLKCLNGWSDKSFTMLLDLLKEVLPEGNILPNSFYEVKQMISSLGLGYEKIHACPKDCSLFWGDNKDAETCDKCGASRWVEDECNAAEGYDVTLSTKKKKPAKILRWFPLKPRLQRLFISKKTATLMRWHHDEPRRDDRMRHPSDSSAWKNFDTLHSIFSSDPRNVRLALASDGFNPFKTMNVAHSTWPVILIPYNSPPWMVMKQPNFILSLLIPGPKGPGNKIDVYMQPLIQELKELWDEGIRTYDVSQNEHFQLHAAIMTTISDFPGYSMLSGYSTKGKCACPTCEADTTSRWLQHGRKFCYMGHRRLLGPHHSFRTDCQSFDGEVEFRSPPMPSSGDQILQHLNGFDFFEDIENGGPWKKKSILFSLPYWKDHLMRHSLDVMHIVKNAASNVIGTIIGQDGMSKDNYKARCDLEVMGIKHALHPIRNSNNARTVKLPKACYEMTRQEKESFLQVLKEIKVPDECSSNISRCVQVRQKKLIGLKSYDFHILMQEFLPVAIRGHLPDSVSSVLIELSNYIRSICMKKLMKILLTNNSCIELRLMMKML